MRVASSSVESQAKPRLAKIAFVLSGVMLLLVGTAAVVIFVPGILSVALSAKAAIAVGLGIAGVVSLLGLVLSCTRQSRLRSLPLVPGEDSRGVAQPLDDATPLSRIRNGNLIIIMYDNSVSQISVQQGKCSRDWIMDFPTDMKYEAWCSGYYRCFEGISENRQHIVFVMKQDNNPESDDSRSDIECLQRGLKAYDFHRNSGEESATIAWLNYEEYKCVRDNATDAAACVKVFRGLIDKLNQEGRMTHPVAQPAYSGNDYHREYLDPKYSVEGFVANSAPAAPAAPAAPVSPQP